MIGEKFGRLTVRASAPRHINGGIRWICDCVCGNFIEARDWDLRQKRVTSCKCAFDASFAKDADKVFDFYVDHNGPNGCWLWTGAIGGRGYGVVREGKLPKATSAHSRSWKRHCGPIPSGAVLCHKCDVRNCVNPDHLFLGTQLDNVKDCIAKGRRFALTHEQVLFIRSSGERNCDLAEKFGVSSSAISLIRSGKRRIAG